MKRFIRHIRESVIAVNEHDIDMLADPIIQWAADIYKGFPSGYLSPSDTADIKKAAGKLMSNSSDIPVSSSKLTSPSAKAAHEVNPITIHLKCGIKSNNYSAIKNIIELGLTTNTIQAAWNVDTIPFEQMKSLKSEFSPIKIVSTVRHELAHWIDDSLHNMHLSNVGDLNNSQIFQDYLRAGHADVYMGHIEVTAMVNQIDEVRRRLGQAAFDKLTWDELLDYLPGMESLDKRLGAEWRKIMWKRMARENLLPKNIGR